MAQAAFHRPKEDLYASFYRLSEKPANISLGKHKDRPGTSGGGQLALHELANKYDKVTDNVVRSTMEKLVSFCMKRGQGPGDQFTEKNLGRSELDKVGEPFSRRRSKDIYA